MMKFSHAQFAAIIFVAPILPTFAQGPKELKTKIGTPVVLLNLINTRPDCSANPGPVTLPVVSGAPTNGVVQLQIIVSNVPAAGNCPARKVPSNALIYIPGKDFSGSDAVQIEVVTGNEKRTLNYRITVQSAGQTL
jgi:hypothetical protein